MDEQTNLTASISLPSGFHFGAVSELAPRLLTLSLTTPSLGPLAAFAGNWAGSGFNTIFRPDSPQTPTPLPVPVPGSDNVLELNLTAESLAFSPSLGSVPNRGMVQSDVFLNGVPYLQAINDVTISGQSVGIHVEPGLWMIVPSTTRPAEGQTLVRMGSIPHGTTIVAQGTSTAIAGPPTIPAVDITPFFTASGVRNRFPSQTAATQKTARIPQDLTAYISAGTITQAMLDDPNSLLRNHIAGQRITATTQISVSTGPAAPLFGGGADNIAFLLGDAAAITNPNGPGQNAQTAKMTATFWIETVQHTIVVPIFTPGQPPLTIAGEAAKAPGQPVPKFTVNPPMEITTPRTITVSSTQIQYSQLVNLNFNTLTWPHVSVATLVPAGATPVPPSVWTP
jgi:hypothetical protein